VADGEASVFGSFFLAARFLCGVAEGEACAVAAVAVVDVAVVPDFSAQETTNAMPIKDVIKDKTVFFIVCWLTLMASECPAAKWSASNKLSLPSPAL
jgi:hypothetical protein